MTIRNESFDGKGVCLSAEIIDLAAGTISFEEMGVIKSTRPLTALEIDQYTPTPEPITAEVKLTQARAVLAELEALPAPILTADIAEKLLELKDVL